MGERFISQRWRDTGGLCPAVQWFFLREYQPPASRDRHRVQLDRWVFNYSFDTDSTFSLAPDGKNPIRRANTEFHLYRPGCVFYERYERSRSAGFAFTGGDDTIAGTLTEGRNMARGMDTELKLGAILEDTAAAVATHGEQAFYRVQSGMFRIFDELRRFAFDADGMLRPTTATDETLSARVDRYLRDHIAEKISLADLADHFHMSVSSLTHRYRAETGSGVARRRMDARLRLAADLVLLGEPLGDIATRVGFGDAFCLSKAFKKRYRVSPTRFRDKKDSKSD